MQHVIEGYEAVITASSFINPYYQVISKSFNSRSKILLTFLQIAKMKPKVQSHGLKTRQPWYAAAADLATLHDIITIS